MKNNHVTFGTLQRFLTELGFVPQRGNVGGRFSHAGSGCQLTYPLYQEREEVSETNLVATRHFLDQFGLVEREEFEDRFHRHAVGELTHSGHGLPLPSPPLGTRLMSRRGWLTVAIVVF